MKRVTLPIIGSTGCGAGSCPPACRCGPTKSPAPTVITRRNFLTTAGASVGGLALGATTISRLAGATSRNELQPSPLRTDYAPPAKPGVSFAMAIDLQKCIGCRKCAYACRLENNIGRDSQFLWIELHRMERGTLELENSDVEYTMAGDPRYWYLPVGCQQCENPPCVQACPVQATWREPDGIVLVDYRKCIGCRYCMVNCPYGARHFNWKKPEVPENQRNPAVPMRPTGVVEKCTFCVHRTRRGKLPACVEACPVGARVFGDLNDANGALRKILSRRTPVRLKEHLGTQPRILFLG